MARFLTAFSRALEAETAAGELAALIDAELGGVEQLAGGLLLATAAAGNAAKDVAERLVRHWPIASLFGTSFEGIVAGGRIFRDEPALALLAWPEGPFEPVPLVLAPGIQDADRLTEDILHTTDRDEFASGDLIFLFPDAMASLQLERTLADLGPLLGPARLAGAAATGLDGHPAEAFFADEAHPGALLGLFVPGLGKPEAPRVRCAGASRAASPWLEITACRERWVDGLEGEPPLDWVRRQLGLDAGAPVEPHLARLLTRVRKPGTGSERAQGPFYEERYVVGVDERSGSFSLPMTVCRGDQLALALPDPGWARETLRASIDELAETPLILQFACRARDASLYGDPDLESAWVAHHARDRRVFGTISPFQIASADGGDCRLHVHSTVLAALGQK